MTENPTCPVCGAIYNRTAVLRQLREKAPDLFDFAVWTTRFRCVQCGETLVITGRNDE
jgi:predicted RNA-binding Zn-ribbon protein involved in translation (DUF1610 family)